MKSQFGKSSCIAFCMFLLSINQMMTHVAINITNKVVLAVFIPFIKLQNLNVVGEMEATEHKGEKYFRFVRNNRMLVFTEVCTF